MQSKLFELLTIGPRETRNRILFGSHTTNFAEHNLLSKWHADYYTTRAAGGADIIVLEEQIVHPSDLPYAYAVLGYLPDTPAATARVVEGIHAHGSLALVQLNHNGQQSTGDHKQQEMWAPSAVPDVSSREVPKVMELADIRAVIEGFALVAKHAAQAGADGVELQVADRSLLRQFLSPLTNQRTDGYGGSFENKLRFVQETLEAVDAVLGTDRVLDLRLCADELAPWAGLTVIYICMSLAFFGIGFTPITALAVAIIGIVSLPISGLVLVWPAIVLFVVLGLLFPAYGKLALKGLVIGLIACFLYDCMRAIFIITGVWGDFIPRIGMWLLYSHRPDWLLGYLWRYIGDGGFMPLAFVVAFHRLKPPINGRLAALLFGLAIWLCLVGTILIAPHGAEELFALTPVTLTLSFVGHVIYGVVIGMLLPFAVDRPAKSLKEGGALLQAHPRSAQGSLPAEQRAQPPASTAEVPTAALAKGVLMVRTGPSAGMRFEIKRPRLVIGRRSIQSNAEVNTPLLQLNDPHVSRYHLAIVARPDGVYTHDIGSANGTWINGRPLGGEPVRLENGAELQLGPDSQLNFLAF